MNITKLQIIVLIEKYKKVTDVAAELGLKQPTVSFHMKNLESELGTPLFLYRNGRVLLTEAGRTLYTYAVKIISLSAEAERSVKQFALSGHGRLEFGAGPVPGNYFLPGAVSLFMKENPGIELSFTVQPETLLLQRLRAQEIEFALLHNPDRSDLTFHYQPVGHDETVLIFGPEHYLDGIQENQLTPELIAQEPWIQHPAGSSLRSIADKWAQLNNVRLWNRGETNSPEALKDIVSQGGNVSVFSKSGIKSELALDQLRCIPLPGIQADNAGYALVWRKSHTLSPLQQAFADYLQSAELPI